MIRAPLGSPAILPLEVRRRRLPAAALLVLLCLVVYSANLRVIGAGDTLPARYLPLGVVRHETLLLDPIRELVASGHPLRPTARKHADTGRLFAAEAYWIVKAEDERLASLYPVVTPLLVLPLYLPAAAWLHAGGWQRWQVEAVAAAGEKVASTLLATLAVALLYRLLRRDPTADGERGAGWTLLLAGAFAFGTNVWMIGSQALWQHGTGALLVVLALLLVTGPPGAARWAALGAVAALLAANRPPDGLVAAAVGVYALLRARYLTGWLVAGGALPVALVAAYNLSVFGHLAGGYGVTEAPGFFDHPLAAGIAGLLASPTRGLLPFSPFLLFLPLGAARRLRAPATRTLAALLLAAVLAQLVLYAKADWRAGLSFGPRWLTDVLPVLMWLLAPVPAVLGRAGRVVFVAAMVPAVAVQAIGAFRYTGASDQALYAGPDWMAAAWRFDNAPFVAALREPAPRRDLFCPPRGYVDRVGASPGIVAAGAPLPLLGSGMTLQGWADACGSTPAEVMLLAEGLVVGRTARLEPRADVSAALGTAAHTGWTVVADTRGLAAGDHLLELAVRAAPYGGTRIVAEVPVRVEGELAGAARRAAEQVRARQDAAGYWLTAHTTGTTFSDPGVEMNTFLTATLVDLLAPVAAAHDLDGALARARGHLTAQIEAGGLVRYHGLPDGPGMGVLGCPITPDTDDTALTWRLAPPPPGDPRRAPMLATLAAYRRPDGLYRTWLAPRDRFECIDPGRDPNPADVTIQMNLLLMLAGVEPAAARELCAALAPRVSDPAIWVYYARAPLVPLLRTVDLRAAGCPVAIAGERLAAVPGQEGWVVAARALAAAEGPPLDGQAFDVAAVAGWLAEVAHDDFAALRRNPPLLYHNDLTASVRRYYWSEDFGYALWLRLHRAVAARGTPGGAAPAGAAS